MAPEHKSSDVGSASKPKRSHDVLSIGVKVKILDMIEIEKKSYAKTARLYDKIQILQFWSDEKQRKNFIVLSSLKD